MIIIFKLKYLFCFFLLCLTTDYVCKSEACVTQLEVLQQAVEGEAIDGAPGAVEISSCLRLLPAIVIVHELVEHQLGGFGTAHACTAQNGGGQGTVTQHNSCSATQQSRACTSISWLAISC